MASNRPGTSGVKRKLSESKEEVNKPACKYGAECYRRNATHLEEFSHPPEAPYSIKKQKLETISKKVHSSDVPFFLTTVQGIDDCYNDNSLAVGIEDILAENSNQLLESVQFNYMFDIPWLMKKYPQSVRNKPILIVHGFTGSSKTNLEGDAMSFSNIDLVQAKLPITYGTHHSKMMFLLYSNGFRVVIHTANLIEQDWFQKTQGVWISPMFQLKSNGYPENGDIFKADLVDYLSVYGSAKLVRWITRIKQFDMTSANCHLIASVPGRHVGKTMNKWGHLKMRKMLIKRGPSKGFVNNQWPVVGQFSSIGSLGTDSSKWLCSEWLESLSCCKDNKPSGSQEMNLKLIYPTIENVRNSLEGYSAGGSLPFSVQVAMKQRYLRDYLCQWIASDVGRSLASPHIKTYTRISPDSKSAAWFLVTSANLSKAAWGAYEKDKSQFMIRSYEIGVLFIPEQKSNDSTTCFSLSERKTSEIDASEKYIRLPYNVPLTSYSAADKPWVWDIKYTKEDSHGRLWIPS